MFIQHKLHSILQKLYNYHKATMSFKLKHLQFARLDTQEEVLNKETTKFVMIHKGNVEERNIQICCRSMKIYVEI